MQSSALKKNQPVFYVDDLNISNWLKSVLHRAGIRSIEKLLAYYYVGLLMQVPGITAKTYNEIGEALLEGGHIPQFVPWTNKMERYVASERRHGI